MAESIYLKLALARKKTEKPYLPDDGKVGRYVRHKLSQQFCAGRRYSFPPRHVHIPASQYQRELLGSLMSDIRLRKTQQNFCDPLVTRSGLRVFAPRTACQKPF